MGVIDFEVDPFKVGRAASSANKIAEFAERTWAFMTIKNMLDMAKETLDDIVKEATNARALELSLEYNFVTPLTSIVVLKDKDRQKIMRLLKEELFLQSENEKMMSEESNMFTDLLFSTELPPTTTVDFFGRMGSFNVFSTIPPMFTGPSIYLPKDNFGGVYRDPHVVLPLTSGVTLCFNWDGNDREVHNLIYHRKSGLVVNGMMTAAPAGIKSSTGKPRVYIHSISFLLPQAKTNFIISPENVTITYYGMKPYVIGKLEYLTWTSPLITWQKRSPMANWTV